MKRTFTAWMFLFSVCITPVFTASAQGTAFTYQGRLNDSGGPAHGTYDFRFRLASDPLANNYIGSSYLTNTIAVTGGLFTATPDFGPGILTGSNYWLEVDVRTNGAGIYTTLTPLQPLTPTPYAVFANSSSNLLGVLPAGQLSGSIANGNLPASASFSGTVTANTFTGNGVNVSNVNALALNGLSSSNFWQLGGNNVSAGQFLGSTNNQPLEIRVGNQRALLIVTNPADSADLVGGSPANLIDPGVTGAVIAGGGTTLFQGEFSPNRISADFASIGGGSGNWVQSGADHSVIGNGWDNAIGTGSYQSVIAGGQTNSIQANSGYSFVGGGYNNSIQINSGDSFIGGGAYNTVQTNSGYSFLGGGYGNSIQTNALIAFLGGGYNNISGSYASTLGGGQNNRITNNAGYETIGGGYGNVVIGFAGTVPGGRENVAGGYSFAGGFDAQATNSGSFVWADFSGFEVPFGSLRDNSFSVRAMGGARFVTGGAGITVDGFPLLASGGGSGITIQNNLNGAPNVIEGSPYNFVTPGVVGATIAGGGATNFSGPLTNSVLGYFGTVSGGAQNSAGNYSVVAGGLDNISIGSYSAIGGGYFNTNDYDYGVISGGAANLIHDAGVSYIGGGYLNAIQAPGPGNYFNAIVGGQLNLESNVTYSFIGGGFGNTDYTSYSVIAGGATNLLYTFARYSVIGGGAANTISSNSDHSIIGGGLYNFIGTNSVMSVIVGGASNFITANTANGTIGGGSNNFVNGASGTVAGGEQNSAGGFRDTVGGGFQNTASGGISTVAGGWTNVASGNASAILGGDHNVAGALESVVIGGGANQATNSFAAVLGGHNNIAGGPNSLAAGQQAQALHQGAFVWADSQLAAFASTTNDEFSIRANNGVRIQADKGIHLTAADRPIIVRDWDVFATNAPSSKVGIGRWGLFMEPSVLTIGIPSNDIPNRFFQIAKYSTNGNYTTLVLVNQAGDLYATNNVFAKGVLLTSDRNAKEHFAPLNPQSVLAKVAAMPITQWNYKSDNADDKHIGPVAQDFHQAFGLNGNDDRHISAVDESGVALSAIQGLNQEVEELKTENAELKHRLATLEKLIESRK